MRRELEADVTEMMNRVHRGVNSWLSPEAISIFRKNARGWGGILESPPWGRNEPTGPSGPLGRPRQVGGRMPCDHGTHRLRVSGSSEHSDDVIQIAPARGRAVHPMTAASGRPGPTGPPDGYCHPVPAVGVSLSGYSSRYFQWPKGCSAPAPVAKINRLQVVSAAPHAYQPEDAHVRLPLTLLGIRSGKSPIPIPPDSRFGLGNEEGISVSRLTVFPRFFSPETLRSCIARTAGKP